jgi:beta-glucosidase/6-phospho-beta-glucosidase/beta-galactosidase
MDHSNGDIADDHYHRMKQDVALLKSLNVRAYRFSMAWSRIIVPTGRDDDDDRATTTTTTINEAGVQFYHQLIDELLLHGITPYVTLFHWDLPQPLQQEFGGWLDRRCIDAFVDYARIVFDCFASKVKHFITINEPWT